MPLRTIPPKVWLALLAVYIIWGSTYLAIRYAIETLPPFLMASVRWLIAGAVLYAIGWARSRERPTLRQWRSALIIGTALCFGGNGLVAVAEHRIDSGTAALLVATLPLWVSLFEWARFGVRLTRPVAVGLLVGFVGTAILVVPGSGGGVDPIGASLVLIAAISWGAGSLYARRAPLPRQPLLGAAMEMLCGGIVLALAGAVGGEFGRLDLANASAASIFGVLYLAVFGSMIAFSSFVWLLRNAQTSLVMTYAYVNPLVAVFLGAVLADERLTTTTVVGGLVICAAVAVIVTATGGGARAADEVPPEERPDLAAEQMPA